jgi:hypothetical protein
VQEALRTLQKVLFDGIRDNAFYRCLTYGICFSIVLTVIVGVIADVWTIDGTSPYLHTLSTAGSTRLLIAVMFISFTLLLAFFGYLNDLRAREDILTPLREKLRGVWEVRFQTWRFDHGPARLDYLREVCTIGIEAVGRKLYLHFKITDSELFQNTEFDVTSLSIQYQTEPKQLMYFHDTQLVLRQPIVTSDQTIDRISFPIVVILDFSVKNEQVTKMSGTWYDVDNMIYYIATRLPSVQKTEELKAALNSGATTFKGRVEFEKVQQAE